MGPNIHIVPNPARIGCFCHSLMMIGAASGQVQAADPGVQREDEREHDARHHRREAGQKAEGWVLKVEVDIDIGIEPNAVPICRF